MNRFSGIHKHMPCGLLVALLSLTSVGAAQSWEELVGHQQIGIYSLAIDVHGHYFFTANTTLYRSTDWGQSWPNVQYHVVGGSGLYQITRLLLDSAGVLHVIVDSMGDGYPARHFVSLYTSSDSGKTFVRQTGWNAPIFLPIPNVTQFCTGPKGLYRLVPPTDSLILVLPSSIYNNNGMANFAMAPDNSTIAVGCGSTVLLSHDRGDHWTRIDTGYFGANVFSLAWNRRGQLIVGGLNGGYMTSDEGQTWKILPTGRDAVYALVCNSVGTLFAGMYNGVKRSTDDGATWAWWNDGLTNFDNQYLFLDSLERLYAIAWDYGLFRSTRPTTAVESWRDDGATPHLQCQVEPNPVNDVTTIHFTTQSRGRVLLSAYDLCGRKAATMFEGDIAGGIHAMEWRPGPLPAGVYFIKLSDGRESVQRRLVIVK